VTISSLARQSKRARLVERDSGTRGVAFSLTCASELFVGASAIYLEPDGFLQFKMSIAVSRLALDEAFRHLDRFLRCRNVEASQEAAPQL